MEHASNSDWVEIIEPKSKERVYANLESGICSKSPPRGARVRRALDFADHWWQLLDTKSGKYYYYNVDRQETVWTRPQSDDAKGEILIIPVAKLQTCTYVSPEKFADKRDASTQTTQGPNLVTTGTQTMSIFRTASSMSTDCQITRNENKTKLSPSFSHNTTATKSIGRSGRSATVCAEPRDLRRNVRSALIDSSWIKNQRAVTPPTSPAVKASGRHPDATNQRTKDTDHRSHEITSQNRFETNSTNNHRVKAAAPATSLSHYLVGEARSMGIALISDDEDASEGDYALDEDDIDDEESSQYEEVINSDAGGDESELNDSLRSSTSSQDGGDHHKVKGRDKSRSDDRHFINHTTNTERVGNSKNRNQSSRVAQLSAKFNSTPKDISPEIDRKLDERDRVKESPPQRRLTTFIKSDGEDSRHFQHDGHTGKRLSSFEVTDKSRQGSLSSTNKDLSSDIVQLSLNDSIGNNQGQKSTYDAKNISSHLAAKHFSDNSSQSFENSDHEAGEKIDDQAASLPFYYQRPSEQQLRQVSALSTLPRQKRTASNGVLKELDLFNDDNDYDNVEEGCEEFLRELDAKNMSQSIQALGPSSPTSNQSRNLVPFARSKSSRGSTFSVESFARENLSRHQKAGLNAMLFKRKVKWSRMIAWTPAPIKQPMITSLVTNLHDDAILSFKLVLQFMGDRKVPMTKKFRQIIAQEKANNAAPESGVKSKQSDDRAKLSVGIRDQLALDLITMGCAKAPLRDEMYVQLARQVTQNPQTHSTEWGLILMAMLLSYFSPSTKFSPFLSSFLESHEHTMAKDICLRRLDKRSQTQSTTYCRRPANCEEIAIVRMSITRWPQYCGVFGEPIERLMRLQACSPFLKKLQLPWILTILSEKLLEIGGSRVEGIFRCAADCDMIAQLKLEIDSLDFRRITDSAQVRSLFVNVVDPHVIASLLKLFFRELPNSIFPCQLYDRCLKAAQEGPEEACRVVAEQLPPINKIIIGYLVRFLQVLAAEDNVAVTRMDTSNLSMVWAPNLLRSAGANLADSVVSDSLVGFTNGANKSATNLLANTSNEFGRSHESTASLSQTQNLIFERARQEMHFLRMLIMHLDTSFVVGIV